MSLLGPRFDRPRGPLVPPRVRAKLCTGEQSIVARMTLAIGRCFCFDFQPCIELPEGGRDVGFLGCDGCFDDPSYQPPQFYGQTIAVAGVCGPGHNDPGGSFPEREDCRCFEPCPPGNLPVRDLNVSDRASYDTMVYFRVNGPTPCCPPG